MEAAILAGEAKQEVADNEKKLVDTIQDKIDKSK